MKCFRFQKASPHDFLFLLVSFLCFSLVRGTRTCYYPDGTPAKSDGECSTKGKNSVCCEKGYVYLGNGVCLIDPTTPGVDEKLAGTLWRGSCTDSGWNTSICPQFCTKKSKSQSGNLGARQQLGKCPGTENTYYCKNSAGDVNCNDSSTVFQIEGAGIPAARHLANTSTIPTAAATVSAIHIVETITSTQLPPSTWPWTVTTQTNIPTYAAAANATANTTANTTATASYDTRSYASKHALAIGVAGGGSLGLILLILLAVVVYHHRQRSMELEEVYKGPFPIVRPVRSDVYSPFDDRGIGILSKSLVTGEPRSNPPLEPLALPPIQSPIALSPVLDPVGRAF